MMKSVLKEKKRLAEEEIGGIESAIEQHRAEIVKLMTSMGSMKCRVELCEELLSECADNAETSVIEISPQKGTGASYRNLAISVLRKNIGEKMTIREIAEEIVIGDFSNGTPVGNVGAVIYDEMVRLVNDGVVSTGKSTSDHVTRYWIPSASTKKRDGLANKYTRKNGTKMLPLVLLEVLEKHIGQKMNAGQIADYIVKNDVYDTRSGEFGPVVGVTLRKNLNDLGIMTEKIGGSRRYWV